MKAPRSMWRQKAAWTRTREAPACEGFVSVTPDPVMRLTVQILHRPIELDVHAQVHSSFHAPQTNMLSILRTNF